ncbi:MAG: N-acetylmuramoyl-L-alanine amidase [Oscillospiraceae bacterium]|nr:N-acetylmuramoyl-L-alanine amidase [Candidatus Equicaccousia limihippi]
MKEYKHEFKTEYYGEEVKNGENEIMRRAKRRGKHDRMRPRYPRFLVPIAIVLAVVIALSGGYFAVVNNQAIADFFADIFKKEAVAGGTGYDTSLSLKVEGGDINIHPIETSVYGFMLNPKTDYDTAGEDKLDTLLSSAKANRFNTVFFVANEGKNFYTALSNSQPKDGDMLTSAVASAQKSQLAFYAVVDLSAYDITSSQDREEIVSALNDIANKYGVDGVMINGIKPLDNNLLYKRFLESGTENFDTYKSAVYKSALTAISAQFRKKSVSKYLGAFLQGAYDSTAKTVVPSQTGDINDIIKSQIFELIMVNGVGATDSTTAPFEAMLNAYCSAAENVATRVGVTVYSSKIGSQYKNPDQLTRQLMAISGASQAAFCVDSLSALGKDTSGAAAAFYKYLKGEMANYAPKGLTFTSPASLDFTTTVSNIAISGASDPEFSLKVNGNDVVRTSGGFFGYQQDLKVGDNVFTFEHKGSTTVMTVHYKYTVLQSVSPSGALTFDSSVGNFGVTAIARAGATVKATFGSTTITLTRKLTSEQQMAENENEFIRFAGDFKLPAATHSDQTLGKIKFTATYNGTSESKQSGTIKLKKKPADPKPVPTPTPTPTPSTPGTSSETPSGGTKYIGVLPGNTLLAEAKKYQIETLDGNKTDDYSRPTNSYMPLGTVDTASATKIYANGSYYRNLGCGRRVYESNITLKNGSLPTSNTVSVNSFTTSGQYTVLTLGATFKMPVNINMLPQSYGNITTAQDYNVASNKLTFNYIEVYMPYATGISGSIPAADSPLFSRCETVKATKGYVFKLYLKKTGAFYGYDISFNSAGNTVIKFLNPLHISGTNLAGLKVVVDAGHGGNDGGATAKDNKGKTISEAERCTYLANALTQRLRAKGATVIMTRTSNTTLDRDVRIQTVRNSGAHYCISIHRNASDSTAPRAFKSYYFYPFTKTPADYIYNATYVDQNLYKTSKWSRVEWHYFFLSRISNMPVVLTENGFMTNPEELQQIVDNSFNDKCADRLVNGITQFYNNQ